MDANGTVLSFDGTSWTAPASLGVSELTSVSCVSSSFCVAVDGGGGDALTFDGTTWSQPTSIDTSGTTLNAVSCPATNFCVAVDDSGNVIQGS